MEKQMNLAIASVPRQRWNTVYDEAKALKQGTIFPELDMPFYVTDQESGSSFGSSFLRQEAGPGSHDDVLLQVQQICFVIDDIRLYLDTHPEDKEGLKLLKEKLKRKKELVKKFTEQFYPVDIVSMAEIYEDNPDSECYCWVKGKIPWENEFKAREDSIERGI